MKQRVDITTELRDMGSPLADMNNDTSYTVPAGYFDGFAANIIARAKEQEAADVDFGRALPYVAPPQYFEQFPALVLELAKKEEPVQPVKRIAFIPRNRWAAAAALAIIIATGAFMLSMGGNTDNTDQMLAAIPATEINEYVQRSYGIDATQVESAPNINNLELDSKDIVSYLNETGWD